jgi:UDP-N-acetyl-D-glucosamine dehydrogenase
MIQKSDCVVITTNHAVFDMAWILKNSQLVVDLRNAVKGISDKVYKL